LNTSTKNWHIFIGKYLMKASCATFHMHF